MEHLSKEEIAWIAGIYEGEGSCSLNKGRAFSVSIVMTDIDIMDRFFALVKVGSLSEVTNTGKGNKSYKRWSASSIDGIVFLETILSWLGERRKAKAEEAIYNWKNNRKQSVPSDTHCIHGHEFTEENTLLQAKLSYRLCRQCTRDAQTRYNHKKRGLPKSQK